VGGASSTSGVFGFRRSDSAVWRIWTVAGDKLAFPPGVGAHLVKLACELPDDTRRSLSLWTCAELGRTLVADGVVDTISPQTVQRILESHRLKPWRMHFWLSPKVPGDEAFRCTVLEILDLYTRPLEANERVLSLDEKTSLQPRTRTVPTRPAQPGLVPVHLEHEYQRKGALQLFAAFDTRTGEVTGILRRRKRQTELIELLEKIERETPETITLIHLVCDNLSVHKGKLVQAWLAKHPRFQMHFTPVHCSWMNQVEQWFSILQRKRLTAPNFDNLDVLEERVLAFIAEWNEIAHPFAWTAESFDKILAKTDVAIAAAPSRHLEGQTRQVELRRCIFTIRPFHDEPAELLLAELRSEVAHADGIAATTFEGIKTPDLRRSLDSDGVVETERPELHAEVVRVAVGGIYQDNSGRCAVGERSVNHVQPQFQLRLERHVLRDACLRAPLGIVRPRLRQVELEVDRQMRIARRDAQAHGDLAVRSLARRPRVLTLHTHRMSSLFQKARVVDDPRPDRVVSGDLLDGVFRSKRSHPSVAPLRIVEKIAEPRLHRGHHRGGRARPRRDRLDALALSVAKKPHRVHGKGRTLLLVVEEQTDAVDVVLHPPLSGGSMRSTPLSFTNAATMAMSSACSNSGSTWRAKGSRSPPVARGSCRAR
jgi:transposase